MLHACIEQLAHQLIVYAYHGKVSNAFISMQQAHFHLQIACKIINLFSWSIIQLV